MIRQQLSEETNDTKIPKRILRLALVKSLAGSEITSDHTASTMGSVGALKGDSRESNRGRGALSPSAMSHLFAASPPLALEPNLVSFHVLL